MRRYLHDIYELMSESRAATGPERGSVDVKSVTYATGKHPMKLVCPEGLEPSTKGL